MMLIANGGLQLDGSHMHQNFRLKKDRNEKLVSILYKVDFLAIFCQNAQLLQTGMWHC